ncbi:hypothetical protein CHS0354_042624 [Potamilus streckersoni]|uniref:G-protein coupled receptors family 2 profile 2 domain-containing protein n=1 Tax=Potamilus streckersoni TaxID=2493646 RepID=A0AAE0WCM2_9BIVA|nr:hypothetical protein CHS0354_042624 [Potamilus streckersoni]
MYMGVKQVIESIRGSQGLTNDTAMASMMDMYRNMCDGDVCSSSDVGDSFARGSEPMYDGCCQMCYCTKTCHLYDACCPDLVQELPTRVTWENRLYTCHHPQMKPYGSSPVNSDSSWMVTKCPTDYSNLTTISNCEDVQRLLSLEDYIPVTDAKLGFSYRNKYCAQCNNVNKVDWLYWIPIVKCDDVFKQTSWSIVDDIWNSPLCNLVFNNPSGRTTEYCNTVISECNITGMWRTYDTVVESACHAFTAVFNSTYRNLFCFLCNGEIEINACPSWDIPFHLYSFSAILNLQSNRFVTVKNDVTGDTDIHRCINNQVYDPYKAKCRDLICLNGRTLRNNTCQSTYTSVSGQCYEVFVKFTLLDADVNITDYYSNAEFYIQSRLLNFEMYLYALQSYVSEENGTLGSEIFVRVALYVNIFNNVDPNELIESLLILDDSNITINNTDILGVGKQTTFNVKIDRLLNTNGTYISSVDGNILKQLTETTSKLSCPIDDIILISNLQKCPLLKLSEAEFGTFKFNSTGVYILSMNLFIPNKKFDDSSGNGSILICLEDYLPRAVELCGQTSFIDFSWEPTVILSIVIIVISDSCLLCTVVTYCLFRSLRTQPGINNLILSVLLIFAQVLTQFGLGAYGVTWGCKLIGILIHFAWLMVLFWMNICCIHMHKSFTNIMHMNSAVGGKGTTLKYILYTCICSCVVMAINVISSLAQTNGTDMGYGSKWLCFISTELMLGVTFVLPISVLIFINLFLFLIVIMKINKIPKVEKHVVNERNYFQIYVRLSTITGLFWTFGIAFFFTRLAVLEYLFIILNGGQGIFIFSAFILNKRVGKLYSIFFKCYIGRHSRTTSTSQANT